MFSAPSAVAADVVAPVATISATRCFFDALATALNDDVAQIELALATLAALDLDPETLDNFQTVQDDARRAAARCRATIEVLDATHRQLEDAVNATPDAARTAFFRESPTVGQATTKDPVMTSPNPPSATPAPRAKGARDPLRVGRRIVLGDGERFVASGSAKDDEGMLVLAAAVDTPTGRVVHIGLVGEEDKTRWKGAYALATEIEPDEEFPDDPDEACTVSTWSDATVVVDAAVAARLPQHIEELIEVASEIDTDYKQAARQYEKLDDERQRLDRKRFADPADAERKAELDSREYHHKKFQPHRREHMDACRDRLPADARALFDALQQQIDEAGQDVFDQDREDLAAAVSGLTVDEYRELYELQRIPYRTRTQEQEQRVDELDGHDRKPPLLAEQTALVCGLSLAEYREMEDLRRIGRHGTRTPVAPGLRGAMVMALPIVATDGAGDVDQYDGAGAGGGVDVQRGGGVV